MVVRIYEFLQRKAAKHLVVRRRSLSLDQPIISFTFDDFPVSALATGGRILEQHGVLGTYYVALDLLGKDAPTGKIVSRRDLRLLTQTGHELGCHTFSHSHAWETPRFQFEQAIIDNADALNQILPGRRFKTHSYPISVPNPGVKRCAGRHFACARGGGQTFNQNFVDLNHALSFFLEKSNGDLAEIRNVVDATIRSRGWLIFSTHDVSDEPTKFGCRTKFFADVVDIAVRSGAKVLPVEEALERTAEKTSVCCSAGHPCRT